MKKYLPIAMFTLLLSSTSSKADTTWGIGAGPLYGGLGLNFGKTSSSTFTYGTLGCHGLSRGAPSDSNRRSTETNCGLGFGHISTSLFSSDRHGLGLNLGLTYNTFDSQTEIRLRPGYHYFFNGINNSGVNLGLGTTLYYDDNSSNDPDRDSDVIRVFFNIGYQF